MNLFQITSKKKDESNKLVQDFINKGGKVEIIPTPKRISPSARTWKKK